MYVILINQDNTMTTTQDERIMQRSKLVDTLWFLVAPVYNDLEIVECTALLEYVLPISRKYSTETLIRSEEDYKGYLKYTLPVDTNLTNEFGEIEIALTFLYVGLNENGEVVQRVRKITPSTIEVYKSASWSDVIPDSALSAIDQRIIKTDAQIKALQDMSTLFNITKADNLKFDESTAELQLLAGDIEIGDKVKLQSIQVDGDDLDDALKDGIPIVDFGATSSEDTVIPDDDKDDVPGNNDNSDGLDNSDNSGGDGTSDNEDDEIDNVVDFDSGLTNNETDNVVEF